jgi:hypothetical protein
MLQRLATLAEWAIAGVPLLVAALLDAALMRDVALRARLHVSPALFGIGLHGMVILAAGLPVLALLPVTLPPLAWPLALAALGVAAHLAVGHFHRLR